MTRLLNLLLGRRVNRETAQYLQELAGEPRRASRERTAQLLQKFRASSGSKVRLGTTGWEAPIEVPLMDLLQSYGLITGGTGSGKSMEGLVILNRLIDELPHDVGWGVVDAKGE